MNDNDPASTSTTRSPSLGIRASSLGPSRHFGQATSGLYGPSCCAAPLVAAE